MSYVTVIGAATMDISAKSKAAINAQDSNPGCISLSPGGVGRNIAENLARLSVDVKLIAALGGDAFAAEVLKGAKAAGIDMAYCYIDKEAATSSYVAILDDKGEMHAAVMASSSQLTMEHIQKYAAIIEQSQIILLDANLDEEINAHILDQFKGKDMYVDTISKAKAQRIRDFVGQFHTIKMNRLEASFLSGIEITGDKGLEKASEHFLNQGTQRVVISLGEEGLYYRSQTETLKRPARPVAVKNATGAGDALMAAVIYCSLEGKSAAYTVDFAQAMARLALMSEKTVSEQINVREIERQMKGL